MIPTYNRARYLGEAIRSVLGQTYEDFLLEIDDNASTDETPELVARCSDPRIRYVRHPENLGMLGNHNQFLGRVDTDFALILPDDDIAYPELLETTVRALDDHPEAGMAHTAFDVLGADGESLLSDANWTYGLDRDTVESAETFIRATMRHSCRVCASTALMRTEALPAGGMSEGDFPAVDMGLWLRMAAGGWKFAFVARTLAGYRIHGETHSAAFGPPQGPGYIQRPEIIVRLKEVKQRFLEEHPSGDRRELERLAERGRRHELIVLTRTESKLERARTLSLLVQAARVDPGVLLEPSAWRTVAAGLLGPANVRRLKQLRARQQVGT